MTHGGHLVTVAEEWLRLGNIWFFGAEDLKVSTLIAKKMFITKAHSDFWIHFVFYLFTRNK